MKGQAETDLQFAPQSKVIFTNQQVTESLQRDLQQILDNSIQASYDDLAKIPVSNLREQTLKKRQPQNYDAKASPLNQRKKIN